MGNTWCPIYIWENLSIINLLAPTQFVTLLVMTWTTFSWTTSIIASFKTPKMYSEVFTTLIVSIILRNIILAGHATKTLIKDLWALFDQPSIRILQPVLAHGDLIEANLFITLSFDLSKRLILNALVKCIFLANLKGNAHA